jgi:P27 family predicted phage terminase small subunit
MDKTSWKRKVNKEARTVGTYRPSFDMMIDTLCEILAQRDQVLEDFKASGAVAIVETATSCKQNPLLTTWMHLNDQALTYWRELGLTPSGLKKLNEQAIKIEGKKSALESALDSLS